MEIIEVGVTSMIVLMVINQNLRYPMQGVPNVEMPKEKPAI